MDVLFTPWRFKYVRKAAEYKLECFICQYLAEGEENFDKNLVIYKTKHSVALMNRFPYSRGHVLIAPCRHVPNISDLTNEELFDYALLTKATIKAIENVLKPDFLNVGINIGRVAGAGLEQHLHIHVIPRWYEVNYYIPDVKNEDEIYYDMIELTRKLRSEIIKLINEVLKL